MHRNQILNQLDLYERKINKSDKSLAKIVQIREFINQNKNCFERTLLSGHITGSAWLLNHSEDKALLTLHRKLNKWLQLGGHADGDSNILDVALREAKEESGITSIEPINREIFDVDIHLIPKYEDIPEHYHYDIRYLLKVTKDIPFKISEESISLQWFSKNDFDSNKFGSSVLRLFKKWIIS